MIKTTSPLLSAGLLALIVGSGCFGVPPTTMVSNEFLGERTVQYTVRENTIAAGSEATSGKKKKDKTYDLFVRLCSLQDGRQLGCQTSLLLRGVNLAESTNHIHWHDINTFYLSYAGTAGSFFGGFYPTALRCVVQDNNNVVCQPEEELNKLLAPSKN